MKNKVCVILALLFICAGSGFVSAQDVDQQFQGFNLEGFSEKGDKSWDIKGETADVMPNGVELSNVNANSYGEEPVNVTAERGTIDQVNGSMVLNDDVIITSETGMQMLTDSLTWDRASDLIETDDDVLITDDGITVTGRGLRAQPGLKSAKINDDVTVRIDTEKDQALNKIVTITSDGPMVIDQANRIATFNDNVIAVYEERTLRADRMDVFFNEEMKDIKKMICTGNVIIEQGENKTYAEKAEYNRATQKLTLSGRPKLILLTEGEDAITSFGN